ncbi:MAG TPA: DUF3352 domain-containing protein [Intrasporangium sp.]|uniref:DUF3352 domain-containing protein n=1 Tax=Intrasporangium sp. TaxID=1925024 RepID=UPI002B4708F8|nr:DUF3352 domain-containing protein [Intrasporangium sp.]HKX66758.1 DUF3352 domain-containing protein [Intrasporangium sp.]
MNQPTDASMPENNPPQPAHGGPTSYTFPGATEPVGLTDPVSSQGGPATPPRRKTSRALLVGGVATVLVLGVGGAVAIQQLSGSGPRPSDVLPGDTFGYVQVDIDPSAGQKLAAVRFLGKIPEIKDLESGDTRKKLWDLAVASSDDDCVRDFDFARDIDPWLGDRVGFGLRPGGTADDPNVVAALQVKDQDQAMSTLGRLADCGEGGDQVDLRAKDGYVLVTKHGQGDDMLAAIAKGTLSQNATFSGDMAALGEQGVATTWWNVGPIAKEFSSALLFGVRGPDAPQDLEGRVAAALRFDPGYAEIAGIARGFSGAAQSIQPVDGDLSELAALPEDTLAAVHISGGAQLLDQAWPQLKKQINDVASSGGMDDPLGEIEDELGLALPDDLKVLLGSSFTLALPDQVFGSDVPAIGAKVVTSDAQRAEEVVSTIEDASGSAGILTKSVDGDRLYVATTPDYVDRLKSGGNLGDTDGFKAAVGDASDADYAVYVDLDRLEKLYLEEADGETRAALEAMRAVGISSTVTGPGEAAFAFRLVAN